jgi:hypothetical protein
MSGARRWPLWTTLIPLGIAAATWFLVWQGFRDRLAEALAAVLPPATPVSIGGFPYRLEARFGPVDLSRRDEALFARLEAREVTVNRQPWRQDRQVINLVAPRLEVGLAPLAGISATVGAPSAQASLRLADGRIGRLSLVWETPTLRLGFLPVPVAADAFEAHVREPPAGLAKAGEAAATALAVRGEAVLSGRGVRIGAGSPIQLDASFALQAAHPVKALSGWTEGGRVEVRDLVLSDATGEVVRLMADLMPGGDGRVRAVGRIESVCPASVRAALLGLPPVTEKRTRKPVSIGFEASLGSEVRLAPPPAGPPPPVRGQAPDCPRLR